MTIAIITPCAVKLSNGSGHHHSVRFGHHSCRPRNFNLSVSSSSGFAARRKILPVRRRHRSTSIRAVSENLGSLPDPLASSSNNRYHPSEDIKESAGDDSPLADADNARTLVEQVIIGLDNIEMLEEMDISELSDFDFSMEGITSEDSDIDATLMRPASSHPMYFARKIAEVVSNANLDYMDQPSASIVVQGVLRPAFLEEHSFIIKHFSVGRTTNDEVNHLGKVVEENIKEELDKDQNLHGGTAFYKLEIIRIQLVSAYGTQSSVEVHDFRKARPDVVVHHASKIISQLEAAGDKTIQALAGDSKSIQVEEATVTGIDSLGFDLRVCFGTQVQTLRFAFNTRATSESSAERQLHDLLLDPRFQHKSQI